MENYVVTVPFQKRKMFTLLRISAHQLNIEKGRHMSIQKRLIYIVIFVTECTCNRFKYNRLCHYCNLVEDENHFAT